LSNAFVLSVFRAFYGKNNVILCRGLKSITDREVCCYMISCKNSTNIDTVIDWLVKHSKSKTWASVPVLFTVAVMILSCSFLFYFLKLSAMSNWVIDVWPLSLFSPCGRVIACIIWVHIQVLLTRQHVVWLHTGLIFICEYESIGVISECKLATHSSFEWNNGFCLCRQFCISLRCWYLPCADGCIFPVE
jgi:hypothetical protein